MIGAVHFDGRDGAMNTFGMTFLSAAVFVAGFGGTFYAVATPGFFDFGSGPAECDARGADCRVRLRSQGERAFERGDTAAGDAALGRAALAGDMRAAFHLGWHHEQAYRKAVGKKLEAGAAPIEESQPGIAGLPRGADFAALAKRYETVPAGPARALADRSLAFLWYGYAANGGFGPAMNNLGAMYQFGLMGQRDRIQAQTWYKRGAAVANPVALLNDRVLEIRYGGDCDFDSSQAFAGGLTAPPVDLEEEIIIRTRFRGREVPAGIRGMFRVQSLAASKPREEMGPLDVLQIAAAASAFDMRDLRQEWDDMAEVEAMRGKQRDCSERYSTTSRNADHEKLERARSMQESMRQRAVSTVRRRF